MSDSQSDGEGRRRLTRRLRQMRLNRQSLLWSLAAVAAVVVGFLAWRSPSMLPRDAAPVTFFQIATASTSGTYFPVGEMIATMISEPSAAEPCGETQRCGVPGLLAVVKSSEGSVANVRNVSGGNYEAALAQADVAAWAFEGSAIFDGEPAMKNLRAIASLYAEAVHLVSAKGAEIDTVADLRGKRVSLDLAGAGTRADALLILEAFGVSADELDVVDSGPSESVDLLRAGELDAFFLVAGTPASAVRELARAELIRLVAIAGPKAEKLQSDNAFFVEHTIPAGTYEGITDVPTVSVNALLVTSTRIPAGLVHDITAALWRPANAVVLQQGHEKGTQITMETALDGIPIPLHQGAEQFYREAGLVQ